MSSCLSMVEARNQGRQGHERDSLASGALEPFSEELLELFAAANQSITASVILDMVKMRLSHSLW